MTRIFVANMVVLAGISMMIGSAWDRWGWLYRWPDAQAWYGAALCLIGFALIRFFRHLEWSKP